MEMFIGAQNSNSFKAVFSNPSLNIQDIKIPEITYEGVFSEHFFKIEKPNKEDLVQLEAHYAYTQNLFTQDLKPELWAGCFFKTKNDGNSGAKDRNNMPIDMSVMLDISGSMSSPLTYTDNSQNNISKLELAKQAVLKLINESLNQDDKLGFGIFNHEAMLVQEMDYMKNIDQQKLKEDINKLKPCGGTTIASGLSGAIQQYQNEKNQKQQEKQYRNKRILFITDMLSMDAIELQGLIQMASDIGVYITIVGVGVSFDEKVTNVIAQNRGCNYFSVTKNDELEEIIVTEFVSNYFPSAFNVDLKIQTQDFEVQQVYGIPLSTVKNENLKDNLKQFQAVTDINTLFSSPLLEEGAKGGLILLKLSPKNNEKLNLQYLQQKQLIFNVNYQKTPEQNAEIFSKEIKLNLGKNEDLQNDKNNQKTIYSSETILKGIILQKYVEFCKNFVNDDYLKEKFETVEELKQTCETFQEEFKSLVKKYSLGEKLEDLQNIIQNLSKLSFQKFKKLSNKENQNEQII